MTVCHRSQNPIVRALSPKSPQPLDPNPKPLPFGQQCFGSSDLGFVGFGCFRLACLGFGVEGSLFNCRAYG